VRVQTKIGDGRDEGGFQDVLLALGDPDPPPPASTSRAGARF
jgi:hypothetical protein